MSIDRPKVTLESDHHEVDQVVFGGLRAYNQSFLGPYEHTPLAVGVRGPDGTLLGGAVGGVHLGWLNVDILWLPEDMRGLGLGSAALRRLEEEASRCGATRAFLDTMAFQAEGFYAKQGYVEFGRIPGFAGGHDRVYMLKGSLR